MTTTMKIYDLSNGGRPPVDSMNHVLTSHDAETIKNEMSRLGRKGRHATINGSS